MLRIMQAVRESTIHCDGTMAISQTLSMLLRNLPACMDGYEQDLYRSSASKSGERAADINGEESASIFSPRLCIRDLEHLSPIALQHKSPRCLPGGYSSQASCGSCSLNYSTALSIEVMK